MRQKYLIFRSDDELTLTIREYAVIDKDLKNVSTFNLKKLAYSLLCEETYKSEAIVNSISCGMVDLIATLRTQNIFPIEPYITEIAESVTTLYNSPGNNKVELFFNDTDLLPEPI